MEAQQVLSLMRSHPNESSAEIARNWLKHHDSDELTEAVFDEAVINRLDDDILSWTIEWFLSSKKAAGRLLSHLIDHVPEQKKQWLIHLGEQIINDNRESEEAAWLAGHLIQDQKQHQLIPFVESWLEQHSSSPAAATLIRSLAIANPNKRNVNRAIEWFRLNNADWYSNVMLATLLEIQPDQVLLREAVSRIQRAKTDDFELVLVVGPLVRSDVESAKAVADWIYNNIEHPLSGAILDEGLRTVPEVFIDATMAWLETHGNNSRTGILQQAKAWIALNTNHPKASKLLKLVS